MKITEEKARGLLAALGATGAAKAKAPRLEAKLNSLASWAAEVEVPEGEYGKLFKQALRACEDGDMITLGEPEVEEAPPQRKRAKKAEGGGAAPRERPAGLDRFGSRPGTRAAAINAALSKEPKTAKAIAEECKVTAVPAHLRRLVKLGFAVKDGEGYREV